MMRINAINPISFQQLKTNNDGRFQIFEPHYHSVSGDTEAYTTKMKHIDRNSYKIQFKHSDDEFLPAASESVCFRPETKSVELDLMKTVEGKRNLGLGASMHLLGIIELLENDYDYLKLYSISSAVPFHAKFGYKPDAKRWEDGLALNMESISEEKDPRLWQFAFRAKTLILSCDNDCVRKGNILLAEYIRAASKIKSKEEMENLLPIGTTMKLSKSSIMKHKQFYNKLFKKYDIDYKIS